MNKAGNEARDSRRWWMLLAATITAGIVVIVLTIELSRQGVSALLTEQRRYVVTAEVAVFSVLLVEMLGRVVLQKFRRPDVLRYGLHARTLLRIVGYLIAVAAVISVLAADPALAVGVGTVTGVVIGFATQNVTGNVLAAMLVLLSRTVRVGDDITVAGVSGRVVDIHLMYSIIDTGPSLVFVPNSMLISTAVQRRKSAGGDGDLPVP